MNEELKPCPFDCGSIENKCFPELIKDNSSWHVRCGWCEACADSDEDKLEAIRLWNSRHSSLAEYWEGFNDCRSVITAALLEDDDLKELLGEELFKKASELIQEAIEVNIDAAMQ